jgi:hypothetical protein
MGIARRKAGMTVKCPTCHAQVLVPPTESETAQQPALAPPGGNVPAPLFERSDFDEFLQNPLPDKPAAPAPAPPPPPPSPFSMDIPSSPSLPMVSSNAPASPAGLLLSPAQATWLTVAVILLVALAFGAGLLVGHYWI